MGGGQHGEGYRQGRGGMGTIAEATQFQNGCAMPVPEIEIKACDAPCAMRLPHPNIKKEQKSKWKLPTAIRVEHRLPCSVSWAQELHWHHLFIVIPFVMNKNTLPS